MQLQQILDSFIIFAAQHSNSGLGDSSLSSISASSSFKGTWTEFSPSNIRIAPFPTREYTDDEFQSITKSVMGVLYVSIELEISLCWSLITL